MPAGSLLPERDTQSMSRAATSGGFPSIDSSANAASGPQLARADPPGSPVLCYVTKIGDAKRPQTLMAMPCPLSTGVVHRDNQTRMNKDLNGKNLIQRGPRCAKHRQSTVTAPHVPGGTPTKALMQTNCIDIVPKTQDPFTFIGYFPRTAVANRHVLSRLCNNSKRR
jgi:hypothetical protein